MDEYQLRRQFVAEAEELGEALERDLEELAAQVVVGRPNPDVLNRVFRSAHSLKGMAGMAGVASIARAAHRVEDLLDDLRMGRLPTDAPRIGECAQVAEILALMIAEVAQDRDPEDLAARVERAVDAARSQPAASAATDGLELLDIDDRVRATLTEYEEHRLRENVRERRAVYEARVAFDLAAFDSGFRAFTENLTRVGEVVSTLPGAMGEDPMRIAFRVVFASDESEADLRRIVESVGGALVAISRYARKDPGGPVEPQASSAAALLRVDIRSLDDLAVQSESLAHRTADLSRTCESLAAQLGLGPRELFEIRQKGRSIARGFADLEADLVEMRLVSLLPVFSRACRRALSIATELGRDVDCVVDGNDVRLDKAVVDRIVDSLAHLLNNAVDHGIETAAERMKEGKPARGRVSIRAEQQGNRVAIAVEDDGRGIDEAALDAAAAELGLEGDGLSTALLPGVSTASQVSAVSGRGVGLDVVAAAMTSLGGRIDLASTKGTGTIVTLLVPTTLVVASVFLVEVGGFAYAIDVDQVCELGVVGESEVSGTADGSTVEWRGQSLRLVALASLVDDRVEARLGARQPLVFVRVGNTTIAIAVDRFVGEREVVVKSLGRYASHLKGVSGAVDLDGGRIALLVDLGVLLAEQKKAAAASS